MGKRRNSFPSSVAEEASPPKTPSSSTRGKLFPSQENRKVTSPNHQSSTTGFSSLLRELDPSGSYIPSSSFRRDFSETLSRVKNFVRIPLSLEKFVSVGFLGCLDGILFTLTVFPLRLVIGIIRLLQNRLLSDTVRKDIVNAVFFALAVTLVAVIDFSRLYHFVRGENMLKLYVLYNLLEVAEKLCGAFGQEMTVALDACFQGYTSVWTTFLFFSGGCLYILVHTSVIFLQLVTLNVTLNTSNNALLTLLISNNFVELKGTVFKKFPVPVIFQISCSDVLERVQLLVFCVIIVFQHLRVASTSPFGVGDFVWVFGVFASEFVVDWIKHCFVSMFNNQDSQVYNRFCHTLWRDIRERGERSLLQSTDLLCHRIGFCPLPLTAIAVTVLVDAVSRMGASSFVAVLFVFHAFICLLVLKILLSVVLYGTAMRMKSKLYMTGPPLRDVYRFRLVDKRIP